ncbi:protein-glutamate O-methyltransferase CheR [Caloramator sp. E03]|uniref:CheR family methyltransferase n=1 Tax=Caloramator sp. E03 TaxID=2576307 RepID=UPI0011107F9A|nr:protein-glutamate O-methyltransferase CheR [Caloramator sp. E03]
MNAFGLKDLAEIIYNKCGIDYKKSLTNLESKINDRLKELGLSYWEYCGYLNMEPDEWDILIELITVNETYFFREESLLEEFQKVILPQYSDRTPQNPLRIWSAACSTGEEPYTLGMLIQESGLFEKGAVQIIASDINKKVLKRAEKGIYNKKSFSFRRMPEGSLEKFFDDLGEEYKVKDSIMEMVKFLNLNLLDEKNQTILGKIDIIFCRNVLIYFDSNTIKKIIESFFNILNKDGYLLLGHAETINGINSDFKTIYTPSVFYYKKGA